VAEAGNPIAWNRYAYVYDNPVNLTDSSGHFVDTLLDVLDLANNVQNCLGDSDTLSCYMLPVDALFLAVPLATGSGALKAARAARGAEEAGEVARGPYWDVSVNRWRDPQTGQFVSVEHFYHATNSSSEASIRGIGIDLSFGRGNLDFDPAGKKGFYVTNDYAQAQKWDRAIREAGGDPAILEFVVPRKDLLQLNGKAFGGATTEWEEFVLAGRRGTLQHTFDYVTGPYLANSDDFLAGMSPIARGHQLAIYSERAIALFQRSLLP
jgi:hypothetical protein